MIELFCERFGIGGAVRDAARAAYDRVRDLRYDAQVQVKANVLAAFLDEGVDESDFAGSTGYGYDDAARDRYEGLLARVFGCERALARLSFVSGTHAIVAALAACVPPGKTLLSDYRQAVRHAAQRDRAARRTIWWKAASSTRKRIGSALERFGCPELDDPNLAAVFVQRSRGYAPRPSMNIEACERAFAHIKSRRPDVAILVDNCYGELVEAREPTHVGADLVMGSLIKNLGGTLAPAGGYVAGRADLVGRVAARLYAPGLGDALGPTLGLGRAFMQGLFVAPLIVEQTLRGLDFAAALFAELGFAVDPQAGAIRTDIVQAIRLGNADSLIRFSQGLQTAMPVNARFRPEPGRVPGYVDAWSCPAARSSGARPSNCRVMPRCGNRSKSICRAA